MRPEQTFVALLFIAVAVTTGSPRVRHRRDISDELREMLNKPYSGRLPASLEPLMRDSTVRRQRNPGQFLGVNPSPQDVLRGPQPQQSQQRQQQQQRPQQQQRRPQQQQQQQQQQQSQEQFFQPPFSSIPQQRFQQTSSQSFQQSSPSFEQSFRPSFPAQQRFPSDGQELRGEFSRPARFAPAPSARRPDEGRFIGHGTFPGKGQQRSRREARTGSDEGGTDPHSIPRRRRRRRRSISSSGFVPSTWPLRFVGESPTPTGVRSTPPPHGDRPAGRDEVLQLRNLVQHEWELINDRLRAIQDREKPGDRFGQHPPSLSQPEHSDHRKKHTNHVLGVTEQEKERRKLERQRHRHQDFHPSQPLHGNFNHKEHSSDHETFHDHGEFTDRPKHIISTSHHTTDPRPNLHRHHPLPLSPSDGPHSNSPLELLDGVVYRPAVRDGPSPSERLPKAVPLAPVRQQTLQASSTSDGEHRQQDILGSGNYIILRGGMFSDSVSSLRAQSDSPEEYHQHNGPRPGNFENFRDFAEFAHGSRRSYSVVLPSSTAAAPSSTPVVSRDNIQDLLTGGSDPVGRSSPSNLAADEGVGDDWDGARRDDEDPMIATF